MPILEHLWIIPLLPLLGSAINGLLGRKWPNKIVNSSGAWAPRVSRLRARWKRFANSLAITTSVTGHS